MQPMHHKQKSILWLGLAALIIALSMSIESCFWANSDVINQSIDRMPQNMLFWAHKTTFTPQADIQQKPTNDYLEQYFSPWNSEKVMLALPKIRALELGVAENYSQNPGWGVNRARHDKAWIQPIIDNMNLAKIPNLNMKAIMVEDANVRLVPTIIPSFDDWRKAGEGYPFDYFQVDRINANTPIAALNISRDGQWYLIQTASCIGWIQNHAIAFVSNDFIHRFEKRPFIVATKNHEPLFDKKLNYRSKTHLGTLYPLVQSSQAYYDILIAAPSINKYAKQKLVHLRKQNAEHFPIPITPENIAKIATPMLGEPYGWGGLYDYNDCSALVKNLFANFGIWLPRNSTDQIEIGKPISLEGLSNTQKEQLIIKEGIPFLTLIHKPGHIMLYIGHQDKHSYILHNLWGLRTQNLLGQKGRAVVGKAVITPLNLAHTYLNVPSNLLSTVDKISILYTAD